MGARAHDAVAVALNYASGKVSLKDVRHGPLPKDTAKLIRIAGGCEKTLASEAGRAGVPAATVQSATRRYLLVALFVSGAPANRVMGMSAGDGRASVNEHRRWLLRWLHPDHNDNAGESRFASLVNEKAEELQKPEQPDNPPSRPQPRPGAHRHRAFRPATAKNPRSAPPPPLKQPARAGLSGLKRPPMRAFMAQPARHAAAPLIPTTSGSRWQLAVIGLMIVGCLFLWLTLPEGAPLSSWRVNAAATPERSFNVDTSTGIEAGLIEAGSAEGVSQVRR